MTQPDFREDAEKYVQDNFPFYFNEWLNFSRCFRAGASRGYEVGTSHSKIKDELIAEKNAEIEKLKEAVKWYRAAHELFAKHSADGGGDGT